MSSSILQQIHHHLLHQINIPNNCFLELRPPTRLLISRSSTTLTPACFSSSELFLSSSTKTKLSPRPHISLLMSAASSPSGGGGGGDPGGEEVEDKLVKEETEEAIEAVVELLQLYGGTSITQDESYEIALKSPKFIQMLIDSVRDLDDLSSSSLDLSHDSDAAPLPFKKKVYEMGLNKGEKGMVPYLEYLGLTPPSALYLARSYLLSSSSHTLLSLIPQVKYVKEVFFSGTDDEAVLGRLARRMMMHLSIPIDDDVQHTLSFFEKIQARRGGLDLLGSGDASFRYLIESFPRLLSLPMESRVKSMVQFLEDYEVPKERMRSVLLFFPSIVFYDIERHVKPRLQAFKKVNVDDKEFGKMLLKYPWILSTSIQKNYMEVLSFFHMQKVADNRVHHAIKSWPLLLGCSTSKLTLMVQQFRDFGVNNKMLGQVISTSPQLLMQKPQEFRQVVDFLKDLGLDNETVGRVLGRCPEIFAASIERTLKKKVEFLYDIGVSRKHLVRVIRKYPELFVLDVEKAMRPRMNYLMKMGLTRRNVASMVGKFSPLLGYSIKEVLGPKVEFLVNTMGKPITDVIEYPRYFSYSLEKKIKPRYWKLKSRDIKCSLREMLGKNDEQFAADYFDDLTAL